MKVKGAEDLTGLTAQEIRDSHFKNELDEDQRTRTVVLAANFLIERDFDVWEYREPVSGGTVWRDALDKYWLVAPETEDILQWGD